MPHDTQPSRFDQTPDHYTPSPRLIPILICKQPKTIIYISADFNKKQQRERTERYYDENEKMRIDTVSDYEFTRNI